MDNHNNKDTTIKIRERFQLKIFLSTLYNKNDNNKLNHHHVNTPCIFHSYEHKLNTASKLSSVNLRTGF